MLVALFVFNGWWIGGARAGAGAGVRRKRRRRCAGPSPQRKARAWLTPPTMRARPKAGTCPSPGDDRRPRVSDRAVAVRRHRRLVLQPRPRAPPPRAGDRPSPRPASKRASTTARSTRNARRHRPAPTLRSRRRSAPRSNGGAAMIARLLAALTLAIATPAMAALSPDTLRAPGASARAGDAARHLALHHRHAGSRRWPRSRTAIRWC